MNYYGLTDIGKIRNENQDQIVITANGQDQILGAVCDGMGGHNAGEVASRVAAEHILSSFRTIPFFNGENEIKQWLHETITECNNIIQRMASNSPETKGMGTTVAITIVDKSNAYISHVGDSRVYMYNSRTFKQVTEDHTLVNELVQRGAITKEAAKTHAQKNVLTQAVGADVLMSPSFYKVDITKYNLLICSDGLYNCLDKKQIHTILKSKQTLNEIVKQLIDDANDNGGKDNISAVVITHDLGGNSNNE
ncbi:MAG: Stp1/IreP family PP2C-type Ser/Thr phosphatase [Thomasclavelia sp.]|jgi:serine/threonine protein phosphatase PrpC|nr:Stp1/IreP family PP2C-type Ser/Thr phosphatase [Thomasclavelia sp.]